MDNPRARSARRAGVTALAGAAPGLAVAAALAWAFAPTATGLALAVRRPWPDTLLVVLSAVPVALAANVARITATGVLSQTAGPRAAGAVHHDPAGWLMMPLALGLLWAVLRALDVSLTVVDGPPPPVAPAPVAPSPDDRLRALILRARAVAPAPTPAPVPGRRPDRGRGTC